MAMVGQASLWMALLNQIWTVLLGLDLVRAGQFRPGLVCSDLARFGLIKSILKWTDLPILDQWLSDQISIRPNGCYTKRERDKFVPPPPWKLENCPSDLPWDHRPWPAKAPILMSLQMECIRAIVDLDVIDLLTLSIEHFLCFLLYLFWKIIF